jgi:hypothetical protein
MHERAFKPTRHIRAQKKYSTRFNVYYTHAHIACTTHTHTLHVLHTRTNVCIAQTCTTHTLHTVQCTGAVSSIDNSREIQLVDLILGAYRFQGSSMLEGHASRANLNMKERYLVPGETRVERKVSNVQKGYMRYIISYIYAMVDL